MATTSNFARQRLLGGFAALLMLGCVAIYSEVGAFDFVTFDDEHCISSNPHLGPLTSEQAIWAFTDTSYARR
jgi:hypothetical protein